MPAASIDFDVPNSPLTDLLNSSRRDDSPQRRAVAPSALDSHKREGPHVLPHKYDPRQSHQQLEQLIAQSHSHISGSLLMDDDDISGGNGFLMYSGSSSASGRPLTSAGRKLSSGGSGRANESLFTSPSPGEDRFALNGQDQEGDQDEEEEVLIIPSSTSTASLSRTSPLHAPVSAPDLKIYRDPVTDMRRSGGSSGGFTGKYQTEEDEQDMMLSSCGEFHVQCE